MPRPLVFGNGSFLVAVDDQYRIRDLFFPQVGLYNHLSGRSIRMGLWIEGRFSWIGDEGWKRVSRYEAGTLIAFTVLEHEDFPVQFEIREATDPISNRHLRRIRVISRADRMLRARIFFTHDLCLNESDIGDTAFYHPFTNSIIHYKGPVALLLSAESESGGMDQYATGIKGFGDMEGTWRDAEDGELGQNPIAQGSVDSTFRVSLDLAPGSEAALTYHICCAHSIENAAALFNTAAQEGADEFFERAAAYWRTWLDELILDLDPLPPSLASLCRHSALIVRTHCDREGAIIAATDSDIMTTNRANYCYMWPRDASFVAALLGRMGNPNVGRRFFEFCDGLIEPEQPFFLQKYRPDRTFGASWHPWVHDGVAEIPFQQDESALTILALFEWHEATEDLGTVRDLWPMVKLLADSMVARRDPATKLPLPSYDLWEERRGIHTFTVGTVVAGLEAAAVLARLLGEPERPEYRAAAEEVRSSLRTHMFNEKTGAFYRRLIPSAGGFDTDETVDASTLQVGLLHALPPNDPMVQSNREAVTRRLWVEPGGGLARYEGDYYFRQTPEHPGNPWIITTLWLAQSLVQVAESASDLERPLGLLEWAGRHAGPTGILPEQIHPATGEHLSVSPLTWSHAEFAKTCILYARRMRQLAAPT